uniref:Uncharacterized protein n=1 Tax=Coccidioides posadasii RMSCC 3488 TaxID=454284 RepID=A0A0J6F4L8_COCPO|nr:hypothetical protein CPAG_01445 [Coccidioides posadasii RMSCC 3488]
MGSSRERLQLAADHKSLRAPGKSTLKLILLVMIWTTEADPCHPGLSDQPRASKHCKDKLNAVGIGERAILGFHAANRVPDGGSIILHGYIIGPKNIFRACAAPKILPPLK